MNVEPSLATTVLSSGADWISATARPTIKMDLLLGVAKRCIEQQTKAGHRVKEWAWQGYLGQTTDGVSWGTRDDGGHVRLSGAQAHKNAFNVARLSHHVSRLDLELTIQHHGHFFNFADEALARLYLDDRIKSGITKSTIIHGTPDGHTLYVGSRSSERFFRLYDKTAESEGVYPPNTWRWEVEYKGGRAQRAAERLLPYAFSPESCRQHIVTNYADYRLTIPCEELPNGWRDCGIRAETSDERSLQWLKHNVRPTITRLAEAYSREMLIEWLGLSEDEEYAGLPSAKEV